MSEASHTAQKALLKALPTIPRQDNEPVFEAPWQAEVFAIVLNLYDRGLFSWPEWADILSQEIKQAQQRGDEDLGNTYYNHWLAALERVLVIKNIGTEAQLADLYQRWEHAAEKTPHGQAIELP